MKPNLVITLTGGGARGSFQAGVLDGLRDSGFFDYVRIKEVYGTSAGTLNGSMLVSGKAHLLKTIWCNIVPSFFYIMLGSGLLKLLLKRYIVDTNHLIDFHFNAYSLASGEEVVLSPQDFDSAAEYRKALNASAAVPVWPFFRSIPSVTTRSLTYHNLCDGGIARRAIVPETLEENDFLMVIDTDTGEFSGETFSGRNVFREMYASLQGLRRLAETNIPVSEKVFHVCPDVDAPPMHDFSKQSVRKNYEMGYQKGISFKVASIN